MILFFTDFGNEGPYLAQMQAAVRNQGYEGEILSLFSDAPVFSPIASAHLLAAYHKDFPEQSVFLAVVDPGVGSKRNAVAVKACNQWFVGPDNGLFSEIAKKDPECLIYEICWQPERMSASFHGRDLFAPIAARLAMNVEPLADDLVSIKELAFLDAKAGRYGLAEIIYIDHYGNGVTGLKPTSDLTAVEVSGHRLELSRTFSDVPTGKPLAYTNANGLIEIAVNQGRADHHFDLTIGSVVTPLV